MTWQLANGLGSGSVISVNFLEVPVAEADARFGVQSGFKSDIAKGPKSANSSHSHRRSSRSSFGSTRMCIKEPRQIFRFSAKPNQANRSAMPQLNSPVEAQRLHYKSAAPIPMRSRPAKRNSAGCSYFRDEKQRLVVQIVSLTNRHTGLMWLNPCEFAGCVGKSATWVYRSLAACFSSPASSGAERRGCT